MIDPNLRTQRKDDRLLDRLGRGEPGDPAGDDVEAMLAGWRRSLPIAGPPDAHLLAAVTATEPRQARRMVRASLGVAASVVLVCGGVAVAAADAGPDSPLWPVTRLVYGNVAESRLALDGANHAVSDARTAAGQGRYPDAARLLATADTLADKVDEPGAAQRLRSDIAAVRGLLPTSTTATTTPQPPQPTESLGVEPPPIGPGGPGGPVGEREPRNEHRDGDDDGDREHRPGRDDEDDGVHHEKHDDGPRGGPREGKAKKPIGNPALPPVPVQPPSP